jgi:hypothetical protein
MEQQDSYGMFDQLTELALLLFRDGAAQVWIFEPGERPYASARPMSPGGAVSGLLHFESGQENGFCPCRSKGRAHHVASSQWGMGLARACCRWKDLLLRTSGKLDIEPY